MKSTVSIAALAILNILCGAVPTPSTYELHEKRSAIPRLWQRSNRVDGDAILPIRIGLAQNNIDDGYGHLMDVYVHLSFTNSDILFLSGN
jgi:tripeptidyl-peptidase-1